MRMQRQHKPSKRALESMQSKFDASASSVAKRRKQNGTGNGNGTSSKVKYRKKTKVKPNVKAEPKSSKKQQKKDLPSSFAEFIDQVHEVQTLTHPSKLPLDSGYSELKPLKLQRQMRLIDLDVQSSASDESDTNLFDDYSIPETFNDDELLVNSGSSLKNSCFHSRSSSNSSVFDRNWVGNSKFNTEISILETGTGSDRVDNIIKQYRNLEDSESDNLFNEVDPTHQCDTPRADEEDFQHYHRLTKLNLKFTKRTYFNNDNLLLSPTSSFNMLTTKNKLAMSPILTSISRGDSSTSLTSTKVNIPGSPILELDDSNDLPQPTSSYDDTLSKYINIDKATNGTSTGLGITNGEKEINNCFSFDYRHNNNCLNLALEPSPIDEKPTFALNKRAVWAGRECEMINGEVQMDDFLI